MRYEQEIKAYMLALYAVLLHLWTLPLRVGGKIRRNPGRVSYITLVLGATVLVVLASPAAVDNARADPTNTLSFDGDQDAPEIEGQGDLTVSKHLVSKLDSNGHPTGYYDDNGDWVDDPEWTPNTTYNIKGGNVNPFDFDPAKVEADWMNAFPRGTTGAQVLDSSEWVTVQQASNSTLENTTVAANVEAVSIDATSTSGTDPGDVVTEVAYKNHTTELDSDESKLVAIVTGDITTLGGAARGELTLEDESGDTKTLLVEPDAASVDTNASVMATSTGTFFYQVKLSALSTSGGGDWDNIESINWTVKSGDLDVDFSGIDLEQKDRVVLGKKRADDADSDSEFDQTNTTYNATGTISVKNLNTLDTVYDDATLTDLTFPASAKGSLVNGDEGIDGDYLIEWESADDYDEDYILNTTYRIEFENAIDLSWSNLKVNMDQEWPSGRYITLSYHEGADGKNLTAVGMTDVSDNLGDKGKDNVQVLGSTSAGKEIIVQVELLVRDDERDNQIEAQQVTTQTPQKGGTGFWGGGNPLSSFVNWLMAGIAGIAGAIGASKYIGG